MGHNIELLRKQEKNSRKPSEDLTKYSQKALPSFAEKKSKTLSEWKQQILYLIDKQNVQKAFLRKQCVNKTDF